MRCIEYERYDRITFMVDLFYFENGEVNETEVEKIIQNPDHQSEDVYVFFDYPSAIDFAQQAIIKNKKYNYAMIFATITQDPVLLSEGELPEDVFCELVSEIYVSDNDKEIKEEIIHNKA